MEAITPMTGSGELARDVDGARCGDSQLDAQRSSLRDLRLLLGASNGATAPSLAKHADSVAVRAFDLSVCLLVLPAVLLLGTITALLIYIDSPGSVFYRSTRVGRGGRTFEMLKLRKMRRSAKGGPLTMSDDERFTPIGSFLAMTKLDELPQLWNVIRGDMRLVGPRPEVPEFVSRYRAEYQELLSVLPGITGPAAVEYASESHLVSLQQDSVSFYEASIMPRKIEIDLEYIRTRTLFGDMRILIETMLVPLSKVARRMLGDRGFVARRRDCCWAPASL